jgi:NAD(P)-dependent dehydrogenase (short-subunit alcohol dehydrogenase family)
MKCLYRRERLRRCERNVRIMDLELKNKVGIITGASRGIGAEIARELAREGCSLVVTARGKDELAQRVAEVRGLGARALACPADLCEPSEAAAIVAAALTEFGRIDFLVANAGVGKMGDFLKLTDDDWREGFELKFLGHVRLIRSAWPQLKASGGSVVFIGGGAARTPSAKSVISGPLNAALVNLSKALAALGIADGVRVNAINPGMVRTDRHAHRLHAAAQRLGSTEAEAERHMLAESGIARVGEPTDIAGLVSFILSGRGSYLQGALINIDGGQTKTI